MIEPLTQQHALEIAKDWHYEAPYDFYDMKNDLEDYEEMVSPEARGERYYQVLREGKSCLVVKATKLIAIRCACNDNHRLTTESECDSSQNFPILELGETRASGTRMGACRLASHEVSFMT